MLAKISQLNRQFPSEIFGEPHFLWNVDIRDSFLDILDLFHTLWLIAKYSYSCFKVLLARSSYTVWAKCSDFKY